MKGLITLSTTYKNLFKISLERHIFLQIIKVILHLFAFDKIEGFKLNFAQSIETIDYYWLTRRFISSFVSSALSCKEVDDVVF